MSTTVSKRVAAQAEGSRALENAGILQQVLLFVGPGCYLFAGLGAKLSMSVTHAFLTRSSTVTGHTL
jgi:hypothetical protein